MDEKLESRQHIVYFLTAGGVIGLFFLVGLIINRVQQTTRYPGAGLASHRITYSVLPPCFHQVEVYLTPNPVAETCSWYISRYDLIYDETEWGCLALRGHQQRFGIRRVTTVSVYKAARGSEVYVSHLVVFPEMKTGALGLPGPDNRGGTAKIVK